MCFTRAGNSRINFKYCLKRPSLFLQYSFLMPCLTMPTCLNFQLNVFVFQVLIKNCWKGTCAHTSVHVRLHARIPNRPRSTFWTLAVASDVLFIVLIVSFNFAELGLLWYFALRGEVQFVSVVFVRLPFLLNEINPQWRLLYLCYITENYASHWCLPLPLGKAKVWSRLCRAGALKKFSNQLEVYLT